MLTRNMAEKFDKEQLEKAFKKAFMSNDELVEELGNLVKEALDKLEEKLGEK